MLANFGGNAYPHKFHNSTTISEFITKYSHLEKDSKLEELVSLSGRILTKRSAGAALIFYDVRSEGHKLQVLCDKR